MGYWTYGYSYFLGYAEMLYRYTGGRIDMMKLGNLRAVASFQQKCYFNHRCTVNFSDAHAGSEYIFGIACYLHSILPEVKIPPLENRALYPTDGCGRWSYALRNLLWADDQVVDEPLASHYALKEAQWYLATSRDGEISLAAKGGHNLEAHNQNDVGSFHLYKNGQMIIADLGAGTYSRQYFYDDRYSFLCCCSRGHAVPVVGGKYQKEGREYAARDVQLDESGIRMDIAPAYGNENLDMLRREILFDHETGKLTIKGASQFKAEGEEIRERLILWEEPEIRKGEIIISKAGVTARVIFDPEKFTVKFAKDRHEVGKNEYDVYLLDLILQDIQQADQWQYEII